LTSPIVRRTTESREPKRIGSASPTDTSQPDSGSVPISNATLGQRSLRSGASTLAIAFVISSSSQIKPMSAFSAL